MRMKCKISSYFSKEIPELETSEHLQTTWNEKRYSAKVSKHKGMLAMG